MEQEAVNAEFFQIDYVRLVKLMNVIFCKHLLMYFPHIASQLSFSKFYQGLSSCSGPHVMSPIVQLTGQFLPKSLQ